MPTVSAADIENAVLARLDELVQDGQPPAIDSTALADAISYASEDVLELAPRGLVMKAIRKESGTASDEGSAASGTPGTSDYEPDTRRLFFPLPQDVIRVVTIDVDGWDVPVREEHIVTDESDAYPALLAQDGGYQDDIGPRCPAAALVPHVIEPGDGPAYATYALRLWPWTDAGTVEVFVVKYLDADELPRDLRDPMLWFACERIATTILQDNAVAATANDLATKALQRRALRDSRLADRPRPNPTPTRRPRPLG